METNSNIEHTNVDYYIALDNNGRIDFVPEWFHELNAGGLTWDDTSNIPNIARVAFESKIKDAVESNEKDIAFLKGLYNVALEGAREFNIWEDGFSNHNAFVAYLHAQKAMNDYIAKAPNRPTEVKLDQQFHVLEERCESNEGLLRNELLRTKLHQERQFASTLADIKTQHKQDLTYATLKGAGGATMALVGLAVAGKYLKNKLIKR